MLREQKKRTISIKDQDIETILFRNFKGAPDKWNKDGGKRSFTVVLTRDKAEELSEAGLNVRWREFEDGGEEARLKVMIRYDNIPPRVYMGTDPKRMVMLDEDMVYQLDNAELVSVDLVISPYRFEDKCTAYLQTGYFVVAPDAFSEKYTEFKDEEDDIPF